MARQGAAAPIVSADRVRAGPILVPASHQYSFDRPVDAEGTGAAPPVPSGADLLASGLPRGLVRVHGCVHADTLSGLHLHPKCGGELVVGKGTRLVQ